MVEDNNKNDHDTDGTKQAGNGMKLGRLFGGRKPSRRATSQTQTVTPPQPAPAAEDQAARRPDVPAPTAQPPAAEPEPVTEPVTGARAPERAATGEKTKADKTKADEPKTEKLADDTSKEPGKPDASGPVGSEQAPESEEDDSASKTEAAAAPGVRSTTSLIFQAPDVPLQPARSHSDTRSAQSDDFDEEIPSVRRRARRRPGEENRQGADDPANTVVKVRAPRAESELITEPQKVRGSTRLEAKRQRRRDGRDAGRRRPVITEAEFLARREAVDRVMVVRSKNNKTQIGVLEDGVLVEHYVAKNQDASLIGNVYLGRVQNVLPSMEAAFVDIGRGRNAVLYSGEVDWAAAETGNQPRRIELALKPGDQVLVQVTKDPVGHKGARLTSQVSLPGRYLVYVPNGSMNGISRKLPDTERSRLKKILKEVLPENVGVIVRTAAEGATEEQLTVDVNRLIAQWAKLSEKVANQKAPALLHSEPDLLIKIVRDVFNEDFQKLVISGQDAQDTITEYLGQVAPDLLDRVHEHTGNKDSFDEYRISEQIEKALERKVWLPSGGSLVMDRTEAMTVVDVNTGKFVGSGGNLEETVTKNNLEAAEELVRQLRLRDIGGIIVVDFIDMVLESNRDLVLRRLVECLSRDRTKHQVAEVTSLGLVQMTRKKIGLGLIESFSENCETCAGRGIIIQHDPVAKNRQSQQEPRRRGGRGNGGGNNNAHPVTAPISTHAITADAKNALAKIAASTIGSEARPPTAAIPVVGGADTKAAEHPVTEKPTVEPTESTTARQTEPEEKKAGAENPDAGQSDAAASPDGASDAGASDAGSSGTDQPRQSASGRRRSGRRGSRNTSTEAGPTLDFEQVHAEQVHAEQVKAERGKTEPVKAAPAEEPKRAEAPARQDSPAEIEILDIPIAKASHEKPHLSEHDKELILDSVLDALPAPKAPGQGRGRSRRVSTSALVGGVVPTVTKDETESH
ncbi:Rne/Rng family ribonuclease [Homoserinimonas sp. OAct 916]|uniref:Rne/Rng family ribonuclease n=1 Tax=Homoserinimonas sp. OAct 916 TaxID=2211450 RepID=UPI000DBE4C90|nr:Rne/Rng family ribonuclease [Homoserinimonas sp. OAct 916]